MESNVERLLLWVIKCNNKKHLSTNKNPCPYKALWFYDAVCKLCEKTCLIKC